ncbi:hypothetical protein EPIR_0320 [Erwinia piriflorinigrans CFBP 5888]|uniref:Uncharacterized protein n=1 Tax=Erwinia piriflorinigrans CFBP 5888 TaxID=1161919 RepID=V5Z323_9GAMM|nr:hypothetical protein EPIR_0320 [Erwinia piriflorinigrans CFBP 5888]
MHFIRVESVGYHAERRKGPSDESPTGHQPLSA